MKDGSRQGMSDHATDDRLRAAERYPRYKNARSPVFYEYTGQHRAKQKGSRQPAPCHHSSKQDGECDQNAPTGKYRQSGQ